MGGEASPTNPSQWYKALLQKIKIFNNLYREVVENGPRMFAPSFWILTTFRWSSLKQILISSEVSRSGWGSSFCGNKYPLMLIGGRRECHVCADRGAFQQTSTIAASFRLSARHILKKGILQAHLRKQRSI